MIKTQILGKLRQRDGCGNREEVRPRMPDDDYDWADDDTLSAEETMRIFEALGPDVEITGPPTYAYVTQTKMVATPELDPAECLTA